METYIKTCEYFYIIEHVRTGIRYAGSKYAKNNTDILWKQYFTSSEIIKMIIKNEGVSAFKIIEIKYDFDDFEYYGKLPKAYVYEQNFLNVNRCRKTHNWFNNKPIKFIEKLNPISLDVFMHIFAENIFNFTITRMGKTEFISTDYLNIFCKNLNISFKDIINNFVNNTYSEFTLELSPNENIKLSKLLEEYHYKKNTFNISLGPKKINRDKRLIRICDTNGKFLKYEFS